MNPAPASTAPPPAGDETTEATELTAEEVERNAPVLKRVLAIAASKVMAICARS
jgi:hypothetical protein